MDDMAIPPKPASQEWQELVTRSHLVAGQTSNPTNRGVRWAEARIKELETRLEIDPAHPYDGISTRDETIKALEADNKRLLVIATHAQRITRALNHDICKALNTQGATNDE